MPSVSIEVANFEPGDYTVTVIGFNEFNFDYNLMIYSTKEHIHFYDDNGDQTSIT